MLAPQYSESHYAQPQYSESQYSESQYPEPPRRRGRFRRVLGSALLLIAVPLVAGYLAFHLGQHTPVWPVHLSW
jgi:hypothetical protein